MLQKLTIRNYALIDTLDIEFNKGLNIITGETGAGKSIILGALSLILGQRAESKYFFNQEKKCIIEGIFNVQEYHLQEFFEGLEIDYESETILRREISADGKTRAFVNDTPVNLQTLKQVSERLIDIHSQHAVLEINNENFQLLTIDSLAGHTTQLHTYRTSYKQYKKAVQQLAALESAHQKAANELDYHQFLYNELEAAALKATEQQELEAALEQLNNAETIKLNLLEATQLVGDSEYAALVSLKNAGNRLNQVEKFSDDISALNTRLQSTIIELKDISGEIEMLGQKISADPEAIQKTSARLDLIYGLQQKHRVSSIADLLAIEENLSTAISNYSIADEELIALRKSTAADKAMLIEQAIAISAKREQVFSVVEREIAASLNTMGMSNARLIINNTKLEVDDFTSNGIDKVNFLFSANAGQAPAPLNKIASGGELSRFMLSVKSLISAHTALPTIIFDEIDTGISGDTALKVGQVMQRMADQLQVITITHLPQIAAKGNTHFFVYKEEANARTTTGIKKLTENERVEVIAEMLSGKDPGASALSNAAELLKGKLQTEN